MRLKTTAVLLAAIILVGSVIALVPTATVHASYVDEFLATVGPMCTNDMRDNHILASFTMAQAIYESGWGRSTLAVEANNLFGMRAYSNWTGKVYDRNQGVLYDSWDELVATKGSSYVSSYAMSFWRAFDNWQESVNSHSELFNTSARYSNLRRNYDYKSCCTLVVEDGYCTDAGYSDNLIDLIETYNLEQYNYDFGPEGDVGDLEEDPLESIFCGDNLLAGLEFNYYLKGKWSEYAGTTALPTDSAYRGDGTHAWNGNSAVDGVTFDTADYNGTSATVNYFCVDLAEASSLAVININGYRENGNRNYMTLEVFSGTEAITVNGDNYETVTDGLTPLEFSIVKETIPDAPQAAEIDQYFNLRLVLTNATAVKSILIKTNAECSSGGFFQFDEITAYAPTLPFTFAEGAATEHLTIDGASQSLYLGNGTTSAAELIGLFADRDMSVTDSEGAAVTDEARLATGYVITTVIGNVASSLTVAVCGDVNGDSLTNTADCLIMKNAVSGDAYLSGIYAIAGDTDGNGTVNSTDYMIMETSITSG